jgi:hypothetical protein
MAKRLTWRELRALTAPRRAPSITEASNHVGLTPWEFGRVVLIEKTPPEKRLAWGRRLWDEHLERCLMAFDR